MTLKLRLLVDAITGDAKSNVDQLAVSTRALGDTAKATETKTRSSARSLSLFGRAATGVRTRLGALRSSVAAYIRDLRRVDQGQRLAAGSVANLTAQFNDISIMMAAGQNPLQLALQQGTQITQVLGPMGAAGAVKALGSAFLSMINPVSLITIGTVAAGAAMFQWLTSAQDEARSLEERIDDLIGKIGDYRKTAADGIEELRELYGELSPEVLDWHALGLELDRDRFLREARELGAEGAVALIDEMRSSWLQTDNRVWQEIFNIEGSLRRRSVRNEIADRVGQIELLGDTDDLEAQLAIVVQVREEISALRDDQGNLNAAQKEFLAGWRDIEDALSQARAAEAEAEAALERKIMAAYEQAGATRIQSDRALAAAREEIALNEAILRYGQDSLQVAELRLAAARRIEQRRIATLPVSREIKDLMMASWDATNGIASVDMAGNISRAADEADRLFATLSAALNLSPAYGARSVERGIAQGDIPDWARDDLPATEGDRALERILDNRRRDARRPAPARRAGGSDGGATEIAQQRAAVSDLILELQRELDVLRETDPVAKEMLRLRGELVGATAAQKQTVADLVAETVAETAAIEAQQSAYDFFTQTVSSSISRLISDGDSLEDMFKNITAAILDATIQAQLFGQGPLAGIFGTSQSGGLLGSLIGGFFPKLAEGGLVSGPGTGTSDSVPTLLSDGEFVVTAAATSRYRALLEAMNAGQLTEMGAMPSLQALAAEEGRAGLEAARQSQIALGAELAPTLNVLPVLDLSPTRLLAAAEADPDLGPFMRPAPAAAAHPLAPQAPDINVHIEITGNQTPAETEDAAYRGMQRALEEYDRVQFPISFERQRREPWRR